MQVGTFAVETATGATWRQLFDRGVAGRLHLTATRFRHPIWYDPDREIVTPNVAAGAWSSASGYFKVVTARAFPADETRLLSDASAGAMESDQTHALPQSFRPPGGPADWSYGVGLWCERRAGERFLSVSIGCHGDRRSRSALPTVPPSRAKGPASAEHRPSAATTRHSLACQCGDAPAGGERKAGAGRSMTERQRIPP